MYGAAGWKTGAHLPIKGEGGHQLPPISFPERALHKLGLSPQINNQRLNGSARAHQIRACPVAFGVVAVLRGRPFQVIPQRHWAGQAASRAQKKAETLECCSADVVVPNKPGL